MLKLSAGKHVATPSLLRMGADDTRAVPAERRVRARVMSDILDFSVKVLVLPAATGFYRRVAGG
jgi:hypothetical protein